MVLSVVLTIDFVCGAENIAFKGCPFVVVGKKRNLYIVRIRFSLKV